MTLWRIGTSGDSLLLSLANFSMVAFVLCPIAVEWLWPCAL